MTSETPKLTMIKTDKAAARNGLATEFKRLYNEVRSYWVDGDGDGELELLRAIAAAADGDIFGTHGLMKQVEWLRNELTALQAIEES